MKKILILLVVFVTSISFAQEHEHEVSSHEGNESHAFKHGRNFILFEYGYTHIKEAVAHDNILEEEGHWVSSFGLDYFRVLNEKWKVGVKVDYELGHYIIPHEDDLKRENVLLVIPSASYTVLHGWSIYAGAGMEFEEEKNLFVTRLGTEYGFELGDNGWELPIGVFGDFKEGYNTYAFTIGIGKFF